MVLDSLSSRQHQVELFERYGALLTDRQRRVLDLYLCHDWSLAEISHSQGISRAAVHDVVRRSVQSLEGYEDKLSLVASRAKFEHALTDLRRRLDTLQQLASRV
jgi:predicted DNA-binding protein YlxM (UPF0122 family)